MNIGTLTIVSIHTRHYWRVKRVVVFGVDPVRNVSIHTRHYWRVKRRSRGCACVGIEFQSTPAITGG